MLRLLVPDFRALLFGFHGRLARLPWWLCGLAVPLACLWAGWSLAGGLRPEGRMLWAGLMLAEAVTLWVATATGAKRLHDLSLSGWWAIPLLVLPGLLARAEHLVGPWAALGFDALALGLLAAGFWLLGFRSGTPGPNRFGPDPRLPSLRAGA